MGRVSTPRYVFKRDGRSNGAKVADSKGHLYGGWKIREMFGRSFHKFIRKYGIKDSKEWHHIIHPVLQEVVKEYYWEKDKVVKWMYYFKKDINPNFLKG